MKHRRPLQRVLYLIYHSDLEAVRLLLGLLSILMGLSYFAERAPHWPLNATTLSVLDAKSLGTLLIITGALRCYYVVMGGVWWSGALINSALCAALWGLISVGRSIDAGLIDPTWIATILAMWILGRFATERDKYRA